MFPSDHVIGDEKSYRATIERGVEIAAAGENIVVLGIRPNRAETGYGYIEVARRVRQRSAYESADSPKSPTPRRQPPSSLREIISGTAGCSYGARARWPMRCVSISPRPLPCWRRLPPLSVPESLRRLFAGCIPSAKTSASITPCSSRVRQKASSRKHFLPACRFRMERSGLLDRAARASSCKEQTTRGQPDQWRRCFRA